jgi:transketolase
VGQAKEAAWNESSLPTKAFPQEAAEFTRRMKGEMPSDFDAKANEFIAKLQANPLKSPAVKRLRMRSKRLVRCCLNSSAAPLTWRHLT